MKSQFERSTRAYDNASLLWRRDMNVIAGELDYGFCYLVSVESVDG